MDELERFRRENARLKRKLEESTMAVELLKKSKGTGRDVRLGRLRFETKYLAIQHFHKEKQWSICWMCGQLDVTKAAYYKWVYRSVPKAKQENIQLSEMICEYDERFNHILGYRRMRNWINQFNGTNYSRNRFYRLMRVLGIQSVVRKKKKKYT